MRGLIWMLRYQPSCARPIYPISGRPARLMVRVLASLVSHHQGDNYNTDFEARVLVSPALMQNSQIAKQIKDKTGKYVFLLRSSRKIRLRCLVICANGVTLRCKAKRRLTRLKGKRISVLGIYKKWLLPREVMTQGHRHAIELYQSGQNSVASFWFRVSEYDRQECTCNRTGFCDCTSDNW